MSSSSAADHKPCILALDQGTTSSRAILFDRLGRPCGVAQREFEQHFPQPGWVEHRPQDLWQTQLAVARQVLSEQGVDAASLRGIGITNQRETTLLWDRRTGEPAGPAIVWQDRRTAGACDRLRQAGHAAIIQQRTGLVIDAYFSATKLAWLLEHQPGVRQRAERGELAFGTVDTWLVWKLTGGRIHATDPSNASRTLLFNIHTLSWDPELLRLFDIPPAVLPDVLPSSGILGETDPELLGAALPIAGVAGDQQAATFGQACHRPGMAKNTYGTGCFMLMNTGDQAPVSTHRLLSTVGWSLPGQQPTYCQEGAVFMAGATVQWLRDGLQIIDTAAEVEALAASVDDTGDVCLVPAFAGLGAPHWDGYARGTLLGMTRGTGRAHIARAALEAIALQSAEVFSAMEADAGLPVAQLRVDGGASANNLLMQMQADVLGAPVVRPRVTETTALGAAYLAGLATGVWQSADEIAGLWQAERVFEPVWSADRRLAKRQRWLQAIERASHWAQEQG
jgi:glycerol kinase